MNGLMMRGLSFIPFMLRFIKRLFTRKNHVDFSAYNPSFIREELIKRCRIVVIDDERPALIDDLSNQGFAVDHDGSGNDTTKIEKNLYDLILLDFGGVGARFGRDEGLSLLRHIKRVNPATFILAYTSKSLKSDQSDFYRLTDATLQKDAGIADSFAKIESSLREALRVDRIWRALVEIGASGTGMKQEVEASVQEALRKRDIKLLEDTLRTKLSNNSGGELVSKLIDKMIDLVGKYTSGTKP